MQERKQRATTKKSKNMTQRDLADGLIVVGVGHPKMMDCWIGGTSRRETEQAELLTMHDSIPVVKW